MLICGMLVVYAVLRPMLGFGHELTVAALAEMLHIGVGTGVWEPIVQSLGLDPIYTGAAIRAAGGVQVAGFAVAGPIGSAFHAIWPAVFVACDQVAGGAGISMVAGPGAPAIGRGLASFGADVMWLAIGLWLFLGWRRRDLRIALLGLLIQAQIAVNHLLTAHIMLADLDASGLPRAIQLAVPNGGWFTSELAAWPEAARAVVVGVTLLILGYASSVLLLGILYAVAGGLRRALHGRRRRDGRAASAGWTGVMPRSTVLVGLAVAITAACSPVGALGVGSTNWDTGAAVIPASSGSVVRSSGRGHALRTTGPTPVSIVQQSDGSWQYLVDGTPETIRGVGYNPWYAGLNTAQRESLYDRDFSDMHRLGINTIEGWFENQFDSVTLDAASRNGVGVLMPSNSTRIWITPIQRSGQTFWTASART